MNAASSSAPREARVSLASGLELVYEERGPMDGPAILLIMGVGTQFLGWPEPFCDGLAAKGFRVIRFDNRDIGLSTKFDGVRPCDDMRIAFVKSLVRLPVKAPYRLDDMAADTIALLDALAIDQAHIVGASMGGMIAQIVAARYPTRVHSLTSMMSSTGERRLPSPDWRVLRRLSARPQSSDVESVVEHMTVTMQMIASPELQHSADDWRELLRVGITRSFCPAGAARQMLAIMASGSRVSLLGAIRCPSLVIHGDADRLVPVEHGRRTADCIAGSRLAVMPGMGHDIPPPLQAELAGMITEHAGL